MFLSNPFYNYLTIGCVISIIYSYTFTSGVDYVLGKYLGKTFIPKLTSPSKRNTYFSVNFVSKTTYKVNPLSILITYIYWY